MGESAEGGGRGRGGGRRGRKEGKEIRMLNTNAVLLQKVYCPVPCTVKVTYS